MINTAVSPHLEDPVSPGVGGDYRAQGGHGESEQSTIGAKGLGFGTSGELFEAPEEEARPIKGLRE